MPHGVCVGGISYYSFIGQIFELDSAKVKHKHCKAHTQASWLMQRIITEKQLKVRRQRSAIDTIKYHTWPSTPHGNMTNTQENITYKRAKGLVHSQQVTTRLQWTVKKAWQTRNINDKNDPKKKQCLGTVSKKYLYWRDLTTCSIMVANSPLFQIRIKTNRCLVRTKDP